MARKKWTTSLDPEVLGAFEKLAGRHPVNVILEEAMRQYMATHSDDAKSDGADPESEPPPPPAATERKSRRRKS